MSARGRPQRERPGRGAGRALPPQLCARGRGRRTAEHLPRADELRGVKADDIVRCNQFAHDASASTSVSASPTRGTSTSTSGAASRDLAWGSVEAGARAARSSDGSTRLSIVRTSSSRSGRAGIRARLRASFRVSGTARVWVSHFGHQGSSSLESGRAGRVRDDPTPLTPLPAPPPSQSSSRPGGRLLGAVSRTRRCVRAARIEPLFRSDHYLSFSFPHERAAHEAWTTIGGLAALHDEAPLRDAGLAGHVPPPSVLANAVATVDHISGGASSWGWAQAGTSSSTSLRLPVSAAARALEHLEEQLEIVTGSGRGARHVRGQALPARRSPALPKPCRSRP